MLANMLTEHSAADLEETGEREWTATVTGTELSGSPPEPEGSGDAH